MSQVFISYKREQYSIAKDLRDRIKDAGFSVWMDTELRAGTEWREEINQEIRRSIAVVVLMTLQAKESEYITYEWAFAYGAGVRVIPVTFIPKKKLHQRLKTLQVRNFRQRTKALKEKEWREFITDLRAAESSARFKIRRALWGAVHDVTATVKKRVSNGRVNMRVNRGVFGEPAKGSRKQLYVLYTSAGMEEWEEVREHGDLVIET